MFDSPKLNLAFLLAGGALQAVSMFELDAIKPYSAGVLFFAGMLLTLGQWSKLRKQREGQDVE